MNKIRELYLKNEKFYEQVIRILVILGLVYFFVMYILELILPFAFGYLIYLALRPVVGYLFRKTKVNRGIITIFCIVTFMFCLGGIFYSLGKAIYEQGQMFLNSKNYTEQLLVFFNEALSSVKNIFFMFQTGYSESIVTSIVNGIYGFIDTMLEYGKKFSIEIVKVLPKVFAITVLSVISSFFFLKDEEVISYYYRKVFPKSYQDKFDQIKNSTWVVATGYIKAQAILSSITFVICVIGLTIIGNKYTMLMSPFIAFFDMLPVFGAGFILWPTALIYYLNGNTTDAIFVLVLYGIIFLMRQLLEPRTLGKQISLHPLFTLLGVYTGVKIFGPGGLIVGPFTVVLIKALLVDEKVIDKNVIEIDDIDDIDIDQK